VELVLAEHVFQRAAHNRDFGRAADQQHSGQKLRLGALFDQDAVHDVHRVVYQIADAALEFFPGNGIVNVGQLAVGQFDDVGEQDARVRLGG